MTFFVSWFGHPSQRKKRLVLGYRTRNTLSEIEKQLSTSIIIGENSLNKTKVVELLLADQSLGPWF